MLLAEQVVGGIGKLAKLAQLSRVEIEAAAAAVVEGAPADLEALDSSSNMTREGGRLYDRSRLDALRKFLDKNNVDLVENSTQTKFTANSIGRHQLYLRPDPTYYEVYHELQHYRHLKGVGYSAFARTSEPLREQSVYDQLRRSSLWKGIFNQAERDNAFTYVYRIGGNPVSTPMANFPKPDLP